MTLEQAIEEYIDDYGCPCPVNMWGESRCAYYQDCVTVDRQYVDGVLSVEQSEFEPCDECYGCWYLFENPDELEKVGYIYQGED